MNTMFMFAEAFNQPLSFNTANVTDVSIFVWNSTATGTEFSDPLPISYPDSRHVHRCKSLQSATTFFWYCKGHKCEILVRSEIQTQWEPSLLIPSPSLSDARHVRHSYSLQPTTYFWYFQGCKMWVLICLDTATRNQFSHPPFPRILPFRALTIPCVRLLIIRWSRCSSKQQPSISRCPLMLPRLPQ